jgi:transcriptional regulator with XRE-family HTH domain
MKTSKSRDKEIVRALRDELTLSVDKGELNVQAAVKLMRKISGLTQKEFALHRGVSLKVIKDIERGEGNPTVSTLNRIGAIFGLEVSYVRSANVKRIQDKHGIDIADLAKHSDISGSRMTVDRMTDLEALKTVDRDAAKITQALNDIDRVSKLLQPPKALLEAQRAMAALDRLQKLMQPPDELKRWLEQAESIQRLLDPLKKKTSD